MNPISFFILSTILGMSCGTFFSSRSSEPTHETANFDGGSLNTAQLRALSGNPLFQPVSAMMDMGSTSATGAMGTAIIREGSFPSTVMGATLGLPSRSSMRAAGGTVEPYINLFTPTYKCAPFFYCRAVLSSYYNKQANTLNVLAGYTIFSTTVASGTIPSIILKRISTTSAPSIANYMSTLSNEMKVELPNLCDYTLEQANSAMKAATDAMSTCATFTGYGCSRYSWIELVKGRNWVLIRK